MRSEVTEEIGKSRSAYDKTSSRWSTVARLTVYFKRRKLLTIGFLVSSAISGAVALGPALVIKRVFDSLTTHQGGLHLLTLFAWGIGSAALAATMAWQEGRVATILTQQILNELRKDVFAGVASKPLAFFSAADSRQLTSRFLSDVERVGFVVGARTLAWVNHVVISMAVLWYMFHLDRWMALAAIALVPLVSVPSMLVGDRLFLLRGHSQDAIGRLSAYLQDVLALSGVMLTRIYGQRRLEVSRFGSKSDEVCCAETNQGVATQQFMSLLFFVQTLGPMVLLLVGGMRISAGASVSLGTVFVFSTVLVARLANSLGSVATAYVDVMGSAAILERLFAMADAPRVDVVEHIGKERRTLSGGVVFESVSFAYPQSDTAAVSGVSIDIHEGERIALVGASGAGKSTLISLLLRLYEPTVGRILLGGRDANSIPEGDFYAQFGAVLQDPFVFDMSVEENLRYAKPDATRQELDAAINGAGFRAVLERLPGGYDAKLGERGHNLSGGERQRLAIARAIVRKPRILIFDEATSSLDGDTEGTIRDSLEPLLRSCTSITIAHRLSSVMSADRVIVMDRGKLVAAGTHDELLRRSGKYVDLFYDKDSVLARGR